MALELTIDFFGLCGFVGLKGDKEVAVLLPATAEHSPRQKAQPDRVTPHEPRLLLDFANLLVPEDALPFFDRQIPAPDGNWVSGSLRNRKLTIARAASERLVIRKGLRPATPVPCPNYDHQDITWLADMELACGTGRLRQDALTRYVSVAARVDLTEGSLHSATLAQLDGRTVIFEFPAVGGRAPYRQAFADSLRYTLVTQKPLSLLVESFDARETIEIELRSIGDAPVRISVSHLPDDPRETSLNHFHHLYTLVDGEPEHNVPTPSARCEAIPKLTDLYFPPRICIGGWFRE